MKRIERPDWKSICSIHSWVSDLDNWFTETIEPLNAMLDGAVEVVGYGDEKMIWQGKSYHDECVTHKALLINIEPIKKQTREERLEEVLRYTHEWLEFYAVAKRSDEFKSILDKAKQALEGGE